MPHFAACGLSKSPAHDQLALVGSIQRLMAAFTSARVNASPRASQTAAPPAQQPSPPQGPAPAAAAAPAAAPTAAPVYNMEDWIEVAGIDGASPYWLHRETREKAEPGAWIEVAMAGAEPYWLHRTTKARRTTPPPELASFFVSGGAAAAAAMVRSERATAPAIAAPAPQHRAPPHPTRARATLKGHTRPARARSLLPAAGVAVHVVCLAREIGAVREILRAASSAWTARRAVPFVVESLRAAGLQFVPRCGLQSGGWLRMARS